MAALRSSTQDIMTWGSMLDHESDQVSHQARQLFKRAKTSLSQGSGHSISGISGNDKALACICLCLVKLKLPACDHKSVQTSLQRTSGVQPRIFSNALKELPLILHTGSMNPSLATKSPSKRNATENKHVSNIAGDSVGQGKEVTRVIQDSRNSLSKSSPLKRMALAGSSFDDEMMLSPSSNKRMRVLEHLPSLSKEDVTGSGSEISHHTPRAIHKTPLNLPIKKPQKPMCIFQSQPILNLDKNSKAQLNFSDWNWKMNLFQSHWSLDEINEWEKWNKKSIESSFF